MNFRNLDGLTAVACCVIFVFRALFIYGTNNKAFKSGRFFCGPHDLRNRERHLMSYRYSPTGAGARKGWYRCVLAWAMMLLSTTPALAIQVSATFNDPGGTYSSYYEPLEASLAGAAATWGMHLVVHPEAVIDIEFSFDNIATAASVPRGHTLVGTHYPSDGGESIEIWEPEIAYEIRTGLEERPGEADGKITVGLSYLQKSVLVRPGPTCTHRCGPLQQN